mmetsp:Transcript_95309/g.238889  ORF Transcript_95309/g.238889 Transcript_95309/m.238889 type:complete len:206 (-) Transcript_95309:83-700(-)
MQYLDCKDCPQCEHYEEHDGCPNHSSHGAYESSQHDVELTEKRKYVNEAHQSKDAANTQDSERWNVAYDGDQEFGDNVGDNNKEVQNVPCIVEEVAAVGVDAHGDIDCVQGQEKQFRDPLPHGELTVFRSGVCRMNNQACIGRDDNCRDELIGTRLQSSSGLASPSGPRRSDRIPLAGLQPRNASREPQRLFQSVHPRRGNCHGY